MKRSLCYPSMLCAVFLSGLPASPALRAEPAAWTPLWNGVDFTGWTFDVKDNSDPATLYRVEDGLLKVHGKGRSSAVVRTEKSYANYELELSWRWPDKPGNSGVLIHASTPRIRNIWPKSIEVQLMNQNAGDFWIIGETIRVPEGQKIEDRRHVNLTDDSEKPLGEWNSLRVKAAGPEIEVWVNGIKVNHAYDASATGGAICLQAEGADIEFKEIRLRPLP